jgi:hypothetical protein
MAFAANVSILSFCVLRERIENQSKFSFCLKYICIRLLIILIHLNVKTYLNLLPTKTHDTFIDALSLIKQNKLFEINDFSKNPSTDWTKIFLENNDSFHFEEIILI